MSPMQASRVRAESLVLPGGAYYGRLLLPVENLPAAAAKGLQFAAVERKEPLKRSFDGGCIGMVYALARAPVGAYETCLREGIDLSHRLHFRPDRCGTDALTALAIKSLPQAELIAEVHFADWEFAVRAGETRFVEHDLQRHVHRIGGVPDSEYLEWDQLRRAVSAELAHRGLSHRASFDQSGRACGLSARLRPVRAEIICGQ